MELDAKIESILFYMNEPTSIERLASLCNENTETIQRAIEQLKGKLNGRGVMLIQTNKTVQLSTNPNASDIIETIYEQEVNKDLTKAELEALSTILYRGPLAKAEIDYIRGVDSGTILRKLRIRGLVARSKDPENKRRLLYHTSTDTLRHLGIESVESLPEYENVTETVNRFEKQETTGKQQSPFE